ncbi:hypothetical protein F915_02518 [Acinetobacter baumannii NIPH 70]|nr:hypothetical protein F915_02518 [Acinetobacter baumannii NIPH 70]
MNNIYDDYVYMITFKDLEGNTNYRRLITNLHPLNDHSKKMHTLSFLTRSIWDGEIISYSLIN